MKKRKDRERMFKHKVWSAVHHLERAIEELGKGNTFQAMQHLNEASKAKDEIWDNS